MFLLKIHILLVIASGPKISVAVPIAIVMVLALLFFMYDLILSEKAKERRRLKGNTHQSRHESPVGELVSDNKKIPLHEELVENEAKKDTFVLPDSDRLERSRSSKLEDAISSAESSENPESGFEAWKKAWAIEPGHPDVVDGLMDLFTETEKWHYLTQFFKKQARSVENGSRQIYTLMALAGIYDARLEQDVMVVNTYQSVLKIKPDFLPAMEAAIEKYEAMKRWPDLVKMLEAKGALVTSAKDKVAVYLQLGEVVLKQFSNQALAIEAYENVLAAEPGNKKAISFLKEMYQKRNDYKKLEELNERVKGL